VQTFLLRQLLDDGLNAALPFRLRLLLRSLDFCLCILEESLQILVLPLEISLRLRHWDEQAKQMHVPVLDLQVLKAKARQLLAA